MVAEVTLVMIGTAAPAPTDAVPEIAMLPATTVSVSDSSAETMTLPPATTTVDAPRRAVVVIDSTGTAALIATAAVPPTVPPTEIESRFSEEMADTTTSPRALTNDPSPTEALVFFVMTWTSAPAPTPAVPPTASMPAAALSVVRSVAVTTTDEVGRVPTGTEQPAPTQLTLALLPIDAVVVLFSTSTVADPAMPAVWPPLPPMAMRMMFEVSAPVTATPMAPAAETSAPLPTVASTRWLRTSTAAAMPIPAVLPKAI